MEAKNVELEGSLERALQSLKAADVQAQNQQEKIAELEKAKHDINLEKQQFKAKVRILASLLRYVVVT